MKILGIFLVLLGILMIVSGGFGFKAKVKAAGTAKIETARPEDQSVNWLQFAGGLAVLAGLGLQTTTKKTTGEAFT